MKFELSFEHSDELKRALCKGFGFWFVVAAIAVVLLSGVSLVLALSLLLPHW